MLCLFCKSISVSGLRRICLGGFFRELQNVIFYLEADETIVFGRFQQTAHFVLPKRLNLQKTVIPLLNFATTATDRSGDFKVLNPVIRCPENRKGRVERWLFENSPGKQLPFPFEHEVPMERRPGMCQDDVSKHGFVRDLLQERFSKEIRRRSLEFRVNLAANQSMIAFFELVFAFCSMVSSP